MLMTVNGRQVVYNGGPFQSYWWADEHEPVHPAVSAVLSDMVDTKALELAWDAVKKVYPVTDLVPDDYDEEILFFSGEEASVPVNSREHPIPVGKAASGRGFVLSWYDRTITLGAYHSLADEIGLMRIFTVLMKCYAAFQKDKTGSSAEVPETIKEEECFVQSTMLVPTEYEPQKIALYPDIRDLFTDPEAVNDEAQITTARLVFSAADFEDLCKTNDASSEELLACLIAKAIYALYPDEKKQLCFGMMTDFRDAFGVERTIAPCSKRMPLILSREEVVDRSAEETLRKIADIRRHQKEDAYIKSHLAMENTYAVLNLRNVCTCINFAGTFETGKQSVDITDITMTDYSSNSVFLLRAGERAHLSLQYGKATGKYLRAVAGVLETMGIRVLRNTEPYTLRAETSTPVL